MQSGKYRSRLGVYLEILNAVNEGLVIPTHIVQRANLSYARFMEYMHELVERELVAIEESHGNKSFSITTKGRTLLEQMKNTEEFLSSYGLSLKH